MHNLFNWSVAQVSEAIFFSPKFLTKYFLLLACQFLHVFIFCDKFVFSASSNLNILIKFFILFLGMEHIWLMKHVCIWLMKEVSSTVLIHLVQRYCFFKKIMYRMNEMKKRICFLLRYSYNKLTTYKTLTL